MSFWRWRWWRVAVRYVNHGPIWDSWGRWHHLFGPVWVRTRGPVLIDEDEDDDDNE